MRTITGSKFNVCVIARLQAHAFFRALAVVLILCGCAYERREDIDSIVIHGKTCPVCLEDLTFARNGQMTADTGTHYPSLKFAPATVQSLLDQFPLADLHDVADRTARRKRISGYATSLFVSYRDGRNEYAAPLDGPLEAWAETAGYQATRAFELPRESDIMGSLRDARMRFIKLEMLGCFGTCPRYDVTFRSDGTALLRLHDLTCEKTAKARVPFERVIDAASRAGSASLRPVYRMRAVDTEGARITLATRGKTYVSDGPDRTTWGPEFLAAVSRFDQLVRDATWVPRLDIDRCGET
jgi:hypothetical protein